MFPEVSAVSSVSSHSVLVLSSERERRRVLDDIIYSNPPGSRLLVNGRPMLREGALKLIARLPHDCSVRRQFGRITIDPDPFTGSAVVESAPAARDSIPSSQELVRRLIAAQHRPNHRSS